jgi:hypothetical protein
MIASLFDLWVVLPMAILLELIFPGLTGKMAFSWIADGQNGGADKARVHRGMTWHTSTQRVVC